MREFVWSITVAASLLACSILVSDGAFAAGPNAKSLMSTAEKLVERTHYLEALDLLEEAKDMLESSGRNDTTLYGDVLYSLAEAKIKGRLYQDFSAYYVKTALQDIQAANRIRERDGGILPRKLAQGYYLEGIIHKRFFMHKEKAMSCFVKAVNIDPSSSAAKRELSELITGGRWE